MHNRLVNRSIACLIALAAAAGLAILEPESVFAGPGSKGHGHGDETAYGRPGDPKKKSRVIQIFMKEGDGSMSFAPNVINLKKGEQVRFVLKNVGELDHEIVIATLKENVDHAKEMAKNPDMEHDDANAKRLKPKASGEIIWQFTKIGEFDMSCLIPGHREAGMTGKIIVK